MFNTLSDKFNEMVKNSREISESNTVNTAITIASTVKRQYLTFKCGECGKMFKPDGTGVNYIVNRDNEIELICPKCQENYLESWNIDTAKFVNDGYTNYCDFTRLTGELYHAEFYTQSEELYLRGYEVPEHARKKLYELLVIHQENKRRKQLEVFEIVDTFAEQYIYCKTYSNEEYKVPFKINIKGELLLDPKVNMPDYVHSQVMEKWNEKQV